MELAIKILNRIKISKPQKKFLLTLFTTILVTRGKINFRNLSRYSELCEHTYSRNWTCPVLVGILSVLKKETHYATNTSALSS